MALQALGSCSHVGIELGAVCVSPSNFTFVISVSFFFNGKMESRMSHSNEDQNTGICGEEGAPSQAAVRRGWAGPGSLLEVGEDEHSRGWSLLLAEVGDLAGLEVGTFRGIMSEQKMGP